MQLVTVARYDNLVEAHIAKGRLEHYGLIPFLMNEHGGNIPEIMGQFLGGIQLQVPEDQEEWALRIFDEAAREEE